jgi:hypothetical protein
MGGAIRFDRPAGQQQTQNDTKNQLFLFRQAVHGDKVTKSRLSGKNVVSEWRRPSWLPFRPASSRVVFGVEAWY